MVYYRIPTHKLTTNCPKSFEGQLPNQSGLASQPSDRHQDNQPTTIRSLIRQYLSFAHLHHLLQELPAQFLNPQPRPWPPIPWDTISPAQVVGIDLEVYLSIVTGAIETEIPIRGYAQTSQRYLAGLHPEMARFVGGITDSQGLRVEMGIWEKEERLHTPALIKIYGHLSGEKQPQPEIRSVREYSPTGNAHADLYRHGIHRIATEYGATCLYLWLMSRSTGTLRQIWGELLRDEVNHMTKFWGFGAWAFPQTTLGHLQQLLTQLTVTFGDRPQPDDRQGQSSLPRTLRRMADVMAWQAWSRGHRAEFSLICLRVLAHLLRWSRTLTPVYLQHLFGPLPAEAVAANRNLNV